MSSTDLLSVFGIVQGFYFGGFSLANVKCKRKKLSGVGDYPIILTFVGPGRYENLYADLINAIKGETLITARGINYRCSISSPKQGDVIQNLDGSYTFYLVGKSRYL